MDKYLGKRLDGRYEIHELIGVGGMANVYRCTDTLDDREVAIKILKDEYLNNEEFIRRFKNESKAIAMLSHPNIVKVYDVSFGDMIQYIVMEYIDGITLKEYIDRQGVIEWKDVLHLTTQVLRALQHAHESGIVHRDIKPQNIMLLQDGTIKVTDFGIARFSDKATRTMTDQAIGSVHYIAPEQARGDVTDGKTDIYSVGVMLYEMLTGRLPFEGDSAVTVALMQLQSTPKRPREVNPSIPVGLEQITMRAMEKEPERRYTSAAEMLSDFERFRLNPSIVFDYGTSFVDDQPTKHVEQMKKNKTEKPVKRQQAVAKKPERQKREKEIDEEEYKEHSGAFYAIKGILIAAVAVCLIFFVLALVRGITSGQNKDVDVPQYVGKSFIEAKEHNPDNFQFELKSRYDETQSLGVVLAQEPEAGSMKVKTGSTIVLTVNSNEDEISVPFFTSNQKQEEAVSAIKDINLIPEIVLVESDKVAKDYVMGTFPSAGSKATIGSTVYVYVSNGARPGTVEIPAVIGLTLEEAQAALQELNITVETAYDDESTAKRDIVIGSSPLPHGKVESGTVVTLIVSSGVGDKSKVTINVDLPTNVEKVEMTVTVDGVIDGEKSKTVYPAYGATATLEFDGTGTKNVVVRLDGQVYREYTIDFNTGSVSTVTHEYIPPTTAPTEPMPSEETTTDYIIPTDPTEPVEDNTDYYDPDLGY